MSSRNFSQKRTNEFVFLSWWLGNTRNLNFDFKTISSRQDRKKNASVCFLGEVTAWQFCFEINWPLAILHLLWVLFGHFLKLFTWKEKVKEGNCGLQHLWKPYVKWELKSDSVTSIVEYVSTLGSIQNREDSTLEIVYQVLRKLWNSLKLRNAEVTKIVHLDQIFL